MTTAASGTWRWRAVDAAGRREKGVADAESPLALRRTLEERGLVVLDVLPADAAAAGRTSSSSRAPSAPSSPPACRSRARSAPQRPSCPGG